MTVQTPRRRASPTWAKIVLWTVVVQVVVLAAVVVWFMAMLSGGFDNLFAGPPPSEDDPRVVQAGEEAHADLLAAVQEIRATSGSGRPVASLDVSSCREGWHSWKIDDPYDLSCRREHAVVVPGGPTATFREDMTALHDSLLADGWAPDWPSIPEVLGGYWDERDSMLSAGSGMSYPHDLPAASYLRDGLMLDVGWMEPGALEAEDDGSQYASGEPWLSASGDELRSAELAALLPDVGYGITQRLSTTSFEE